jgi:hypothetical protein
MDTLCNVQSTVNIFISLNIYHFFLVKLSKMLSSGSFETYSALLLSTPHPQLSRTTLGLISPVYE